MSFFAILFITLLVIKLTGHNLSWWAVFAPLLAEFVIDGVLIAGALAGRKRAAKITRKAFDEFDRRSEELFKKGPHHR